MAKSSGKDQSYSPKEAKQRFEKTLRAALSTPPKPLKEKPKAARRKGKG